MLDVELFINLALTLSIITITIEFVFRLRQVFSYLPDPFTNALNTGLLTLKTTLDKALASESYVIRFYLCVCSRIILVGACCYLFFYTSFVRLVDILIGKWIRKLNVIPFETRRRVEKWEDPGVIEMKALLRGEDCFSHNLNQGQIRPAPPPDFNPFAEVHLASRHLNVSNSVSRLHAFLSRQRGPSDGVIQRISSRFDDFLLHQFTSSVAINKRY